MPERAVPGQRLGFLQALRAIAALLVLCFHASRELLWRSPGASLGPLGLADIGDFGVDLFFVISGFIMYHVTAGRPAGVPAARAFLLKRLLRIVPLYWLFTLLFVLPLLLAPETLHRRGFSWPYIVSSFAFVPWQRPDDVVPSISPVFGLGWTLNYEMIFYLLVAAALALGIRRRFLLIGLLFAALGAIGFAVPPQAPQLYFWTRTLLLEFAMGAIVAALFRDGRRLGTPAGLAAIAAGILLWIAAGRHLPVRDGTMNIRGLSWGVAAALLIAGASLAPAIARALGGRPGGLLERLGDASFSLYLCHLFVIRAASLALARLGVVGMPTLFIAANLLAACVVAMLIHRYVERPILAAGHRAIDRSAAAPG